MDDERSRLQQAIDALEAQRPALGDMVVETALAPLHKRLAELGEPAADLPEQRKLVTLLFADLVGFTPLAERMDPEDVREVLNAYFLRWQSCIERHGGQVEKYIGDAVMAVFGARKSQEDDPENAIRCALEMRLELERYNQELSASLDAGLQMRIGIHTGPVVISTLGERRGQELVVVGDAVNLASRLQSAAPPGGILISHDTYRHVRGLFDIQALDPVALKGKSRPVHVYLVQRIKGRSFQNDTRGLEGIETPLVGRQAELEALKDAYRQAAGGKRLVHVLLVGEAGLGKTRLLAELTDWLEAQPESVLLFRGRSGPSMQNIPYSLVRDLFSLRFGILETDTAEAARQKWERGLFVDNADASAPIPEGGLRLGELLGFEPCLSGCADARQLRSLSLVYLGEYFRALAARQPLAIFLEDLHWCDDSSLGVLQKLLEASSTAGQPILLIATARPSFLQDQHTWGNRLPSGSYRQVELQPLDESDRRLLVRRVLERVEDLPDALVELVANNAEGNPFYTEELVKMLIEDGVIHDRGEAWSIAPGRLQQLRLPPTLVEVLQARFDSLPVKERLVLQRASVVGRIFWDQAVAAASSDLDLEETYPLYEDLRIREMIFPNRTSSFENAREYRFKHALLRDVTYESLLKRLRRIYHSQIGLWLEDATRLSGRVNEYAALIAYHYDEGGRTEQALQWYEQAGDMAAAHFANAEAERSYSRALELLPGNDTAHRYTLICKREKILDMIGDRPRQRQDLEELSNLCALLEDSSVESFLRRAGTACRFSAYLQHIGDYAKGAEYGRQAAELAKASGSLELEGQAYHAWASSVWHSGDLILAQSLFEQARARSEAAGLDNAQANSLRGLGVVCDLLGEYSQSQAYLEKALEIHRRSGDLQGESSALNSLGVLAVHQDDYQRALEQLESSLQLKRRLGDRMGETITLVNLGITASNLHNPQESAGYFRQALVICEQIDDREGLAGSLAGLGSAFFTAGDYDQAQEYRQRAVDAFRLIEDISGLGSELTGLALIAFERGQYDQALDYAGQAQEMLKASSYRYELGYPLLLTGYIHLECKRLEQAGAAFLQVLDLRRDMEIDNLVPDALAGLARVHLEEGQVQQAVETLQPVLSALGYDNKPSYNETSTPDMSHLISAGMSEPVDIYYSVYACLAAAGDPRARRAVQDGCQVFQSYTAALDGAAQQRAQAAHLNMRRLQQAYQAENPEEDNPDGLER